MTLSFHFLHPPLERRLSVASQSTNDGTVVNTLSGVPTHVIGRRKGTRRTSGMTGLGSRWKIIPPFHVRFYVSWISRCYLPGTNISLLMATVSTELMYPPNTMLLTSSRTSLRGWNSADSYIGVNSTMDSTFSMRRHVLTLLRCSQSTNGFVG